MTEVQPVAAVRTAPASVGSDRSLALLGLCGVLSALALELLQRLGSPAKAGRRVAFLASSPDVAAYTASTSRERRGQSGCRRASSTRRTGSAHGGSPPSS
jgi:hypothetical protein